MTFEVSFTKTIQAREYEPVRVSITTSVEELKDISKMFDIIQDEALEWLKAKYPGVYIE